MDGLVARWSNVYWVKNLGEGGISVTANLIPNQNLWNKVPAEAILPCAVVVDSDDQEGRIGLA